MGRREINAAIFQDTAEFVKGNEQLWDSITQTRKSQKMIPAEEKIVEQGMDKEQEARIIVSGKRTLEAASAYRDKRICILNFASATNPGGGVVRGSSAQEESLCRCSTLYFCLDTPEVMRDFYEPHRKAHNPLYNNDILYSPDVYVIKTDTSAPKRMPEKEWYQVNVITCAAPNLRKHPSNAMNPNAGSRAAKMSEEELEKLLEGRLRKIFAVAAKEENEVLILGAFGCGAFCNPPRVVAKVFHKITDEYRRKFETIEYAVFHTEREKENYEAFRQEFM